MEHANKSDVLRQGVIVFVFLALLTALEFFVAVQIGATVLLALIAFVKVGLVMYYYMHIYRLNLQDQDLDRHSDQYKLGTSRIGLWLFLLSDAFIFGGLFVSRFNLLGLGPLPLSPDSQFIAVTITSVLLLSSFFMNRAEVSMEHGDRRGFIVGISLTILLGLAFLAGVVVVEWPSAISAGVTPSSNAAGAVFFVMTGMHAFHVLTGVIFLSIVLRNGSRGLYSAEKHWAVESAAVYWHFVDVVWIFFYPALYLIGKLI
ncbi:MAG TPA: cytochrome c oxidase subunit 3 [Anaerolineales bacterium]|nr:cytochrome c oxidase subunit 3 [Anaerolineales bacterium]